MNFSEMFHGRTGNTVESTVHKMKHHNVGAVVVIDDGHVAGIVADRDIASKLGTNEAKPTTPINETMSKDVITIWHDQGVFNATQYMLGHKIRRLVSSRVMTFSFFWPESFERDEGDRTRCGDEILLM